MTAERTPHTFQADLRGLVDPLSHHLCSSPRGNLGELPQNGVGAVTARRHHEGAAPGQVHPPAGPVPHLDDRDARHEPARGHEQGRAGDPWAGILGYRRGTAHRARPVLNHLNPSVRSTSSPTTPKRAATAVEALRGRAPMVQRPLRPADSALLNRSFLDLPQWATHRGGTDQEDSR